MRGIRATAEKARPVVYNDEHVGTAAVWCVPFFGAVGSINYKRKRGEPLIVH